MVKQEEIKLWLELSERYFNKEDARFNENPCKSMTKEDELAWTELWCRIELDSSLIVGEDPFYEHDGYWDGNGRYYKASRMTKFIKKLGLEKVRQLYREQRVDSYSWDDDEEYYE